MAKIVAVTACPTGIAHTFMAAEALRRAALGAGHDIRVETQGSAGSADLLSSADIASADAVILAADVAVDESRFAGKKIIRASSRDAIRDAAGLVAQAAGGTGSLNTGAAPAAAAGLTSAAPATPAPSADTGGKKYIVGITSCPTGIAHTFMAAEGLEGGARALGYDVKVETQGSVGAGNPLSADDIRRADVVVIAADTNVDLSRFGEKGSTAPAPNPPLKTEQPWFALPLSKRPFRVEQEPPPVLAQVTLSPTLPPPKPPKTRACPAFTSTS